MHIDTMTCPQTSACGKVLESVIWCLEDRGNHGTWPHISSETWPHRPYRHHLQLVPRSVIFETEGAGITSVIPVRLSVRVRPKRILAPNLAIQGTGRHFQRVNVNLPNRSLLPVAATPEPPPLHKSTNW
jgi:hypothetical protein